MVTHIAFSLFFCTCLSLLNIAQAAHLEGNNSFSWKTKIAVDKSIREQKRKDDLAKKLIEIYDLPARIINVTAYMRYDSDTLHYKINCAHLTRSSRVTRKKPGALIYESPLMGRVYHSRSQDGYTIELDHIIWVQKRTLHLNELSIIKCQDGQIKGTVSATQKLPYDSTRGYQTSGAAGTIDDATELFDALVELYQQELRQEADIFFTEIIPIGPIRESVTKTSISYLLLYYVPDQCHHIQFGRIPCREYFPHVIMVEKNILTGEYCFPNMQPQTGKFRPLASDHAVAFFNTLERLFLEENLKDVFDTESRGEWFKVPYESVTCEVFEEDSDDDITFLSTTSSYSKERT